MLDTYKLHLALNTLKNPLSTQQACLDAINEAVQASSCATAQDKEALTQWVSQGPWRNNPPVLYTFAQNHLMLVTPNQTPLAHTLREHCKDEWNKTPSLMKDTALAWCLDRPLQGTEIRNTLRCARRWCLRGGSTIMDACASWDEGAVWRDVYMYGLWRARVDNGFVLNHEEERLLQERRHPKTLLYWLDAAHSLDTLNKNIQKQDTRMLHALASLSNPDPADLALMAWRHQEPIVNQSFSFGD